MKRENRFPDKYTQMALSIPPGSEVLDVGCGEGQLAARLAGTQCRIDGIDLSLARLTANRACYRAVAESDISAPDALAGSADYDVIVLADVLEHLVRPESLLRRIGPRLRPGGKLVISLPNVAYFANRIALLRGHWHYEDEGILDRTHLRFFTRATAQDLIENGGWTVQAVWPEIPVITAEWKQRIFHRLAHGFPGLFAIGWIFETYSA